MTAKRQPWEQQDGEPGDSFARFEVYRCMGLSRSLRKAFRRWLTAENQATAGNGWQQFSGTWGRESARWEWVSRAEAWDAFFFGEQARQAVGLFAQALQEATRQLLKKVRKAPDPATLTELFEAFHAIAALLPPDAIRDLLAEARKYRDDPSFG